MTQQTGFRKYIIDQKDNFDLLQFYKHFSFRGQEQAERALKNILEGLKKKAGEVSQLNILINAIEKNDYELLKEEVTEDYWAKKKTQRKTFEAAYKQKELALEVALEIDEEAIGEVQAQRKRKIDKQDAKEKKKQKIMEREGEEAEKDKVEQEEAEKEKGDKKISNREKSPTPDDETSLAMFLNPQKRQRKQVVKEDFISLSQISDEEVAASSNNLSTESSYYPSDLKNVPEAYIYDINFIELLADNITTLPVSSYINKNIIKTKKSLAEHISKMHSKICKGTMGMIRKKMGRFVRRARKDLEEFLQTDECQNYFENCSLKNSPPKDFINIIECKEHYINEDVLQYARKELKIKLLTIGRERRGRSTKQLFMKKPSFLLKAINKKE